MIRWYADDRGRHWSTSPLIPKSRGGLVYKGVLSGSGEVGYSGSRVGGTHYSVLEDAQHAEEEALLAEAENVHKVLGINIRRFKRDRALPDVPPEDLPRLGQTAEEWKVEHDQRERELLEE